MNQDVWAWKLESLKIQAEKLSNGRIVLSLGQIDIYLSREQADKIRTYLDYLFRDEGVQEDYITRLKDDQRKSDWHVSL